MGTTVRARLTIGVSDRTRAETIADRLRSTGFHVEGVRSSSLTVEGSKTLFENVFHCKVEERDGKLSIVDGDKLPEDVGGSRASLYVPTAPQFFT